MSELFAVPSRRHEMGDFAFGAAIFLLAVSTVLVTVSMNMTDYLVIVGGLMGATALLIRGVRARSRRLARSQDVQRLQRAISNAVDF